MHLPAINWDANSPFHVAHADELLVSRAGRTFGASLLACITSVKEVGAALQ